MGTRGPVAKPAATRRRTNKTTKTTSKATKKAVTPTAHLADENWHPIAKRWFNSLAESGQVIFYQESDWAYAAFIAESMSRDLGPQFVGFTEKGDVINEIIPIKGASMAGYDKASVALLATEGARRRLGVELKQGEQADPDEDRAKASITSLSAARARKSG